MDNIQGRYQKILKKVSALASSRSVQIIAVSKTQPIEKIEELYHLGHRDFGENYVQELISKAKALNAKGLEKIRWHFVGHLQRNKTKQVLPYIHSLHSLDNLSLARNLDALLSDSKDKPEIYIEINIDKEKSKSGLPPEELSDFYKEIQALSSLNVVGLMCIPSSRNPRQSFEKLIRLAQSVDSNGLQRFSMGMSEDYEAAIEVGSTCIRIGTALFGARLKKG